MLKFYDWGIGIGCLVIVVLCAGTIGFNMLYGDPQRLTVAKLQEIEIQLKRIANHLEKQNNISNQPHALGPYVSPQTLPNLPPYSTYGDSVTVEELKERWKKRENKDKVLYKITPNGD